MTGLFKIFKVIKTGPVHKTVQIGGEMKTKCIWYPGLDSEPEKGH